jgi:hypothetical protein
VGEVPTARLLRPYEATRQHRGAAARDRVCACGKVAWECSALVHAEYQSHVHHCADCNVDLVEPPPEIYQGRTFIQILKPYGVLIVMPITLLAAGLSFVTLPEGLISDEVCTFFLYTGFVFTCIFCDTIWYRGFGLTEKTVTQKLPALLRIRAVFLVVVFAAVAGAKFAYPHLPAFWTLERTIWHRRPTTYFEQLPSLSFGVAAMTNVYVARQILSRTVRAEAANSSAGRL